MQVINIGTQIATCGNFDVSHSDFFSNNTFLDAEIIFWNIQSTYSNMGSSNSKLKIIESQQKKLYSEKLNSRKKQFKEFFSIGRLLVITTPIDYKYHYKLKDDNKAEGTIDIWEALNITSPSCSTIEGKNIQGNENYSANLFLDRHSNRLFYNRKVEKSEGSPLFYIKDTKHVVGEYYLVGTGIILVIPEFTRTNEPPENSVFIDSLINLSQRILDVNSKRVKKIPGLVDKYVLSEEQVELDKRDNLIKKKKEIENEINIQDQILDENKRMKLLFSGDGTSLEIICKEVFENIGFEVNTPDGNRDDLIIKLNKRVAVVEIKGVTKSSAEKHSAQLQKWISDYHIENGINPKGILIVNTYKNMALMERIDNDFPDQMMKYVNQMEIGRAHV